MKTYTALPVRLLHLLLCVGLAFFSGATAQAQTVVTNNWLGLTSDYNVPSNWSQSRVPTSGDNVIIATGVPSQPVITDFGQAGNLTINAGASLTLALNSNLDLYGNLTLNNGMLSGTGSLTTRGLVQQILGGTSPTPIVLNDLIVAGTTGALLTMPLTLSRLLQLTGNLTINTSLAVAPTIGSLTLLSTLVRTAFVVVAPAAPTIAVPNPPTAPTVLGKVTVQRAINSSNAGLGYRHYSSPVSDTNVGDLATSGFTPEISMAAVYNTSATPPTTRPFPTVYSYDQALVNRTNSSPDFDKGFVAPLSLLTPLTSGQGYTVNLTGTQLVDFYGTLTSGNVSVSVARNSPGTLNESSSGWQFLGNPYPAPIDLSKTEAVAARAAAGLDPSVYVFSSTSQYGGMYRAYTNNVGGNPVIPLGQAFFTRKTAAGTSTFTFSNSFRLTTSDNTLFQRPVADTRPQLELTLGSPEVTALDIYTMYFEAGSTAGTDARFDAVKMVNTNGASLGSLSANGEALAIDGRPVPTSQLTVPLQVTVPTTGTYQLQVSKLANMNGLYPYLHDKQLGSLTDLSQQASYPFTQNAANTAARFELVFAQRPLATVPTALAQQVALYPNPAKTSAFLELPASLGNEAVAATLLDAMGRTVRTLTLPAKGAATHELDLRGLATGVYALRLRTSAGTVVNRLTVE